MKAIERRPLEYFCYDLEHYGKIEAFSLAIRQQYCKYLKALCSKPRKSTPEIRVGICSVGASVAGRKVVKPVIICPMRFREDAMFETIRLKYLSDWKNVKWIPEVSIGVGGNVDYVAVETDKKGRITDFLCVEIQAAGTTGSPYYWIENLRKTGRLTKPVKHNYGINWANEFTKTMMQQAYKKGKIAEHWGRKIVFVIQDVALEYLRKKSDCSKLVCSNPALPIDFCSFKLEWNNSLEY